jgi:hypothetical protein
MLNEIAKLAEAESNFDEAHAFFWLGEDRIVVRELDAVSDAVRVESFGGDEENWIMYDTAQVRMKFFWTIAPRTLSSIPGLQMVLDFLKQIVLPVYVTGTLNEPVVALFSLRASEIESAQDQFPRRPGGG